MKNKTLTKNMPNVKWKAIPPVRGPNPQGVNDGNVYSSNKHLQEPLEGNVKLYESKAIHGLLVDHRETPSLAMNDWDHIQRLLVREPLDA
jgi:hypothetical protein